MIPFLHGIKATVLSIFILCISFVLLNEFPHFWQAWLVVSPTLVTIIASITFLLAAQFSRSRFSWLALFWLGFYLYLYFDLNWLASLNLSLFHSKTNGYQQSQWFMLAAVFFLTSLTLTKDRGLISIHSVYRLGLSIAMLFLAYGWLALAAIVQKNYLNQHALAVYLSVELPLLICSLLVLWQSIKSSSLFASAIASTLVIWSLYYYQGLQLPWSMTLFLLCCHYLLVVIIDSYFLAYRDELTELPSRRALQQLVLSLGRKYTVAMLDVDHFKKFNDTYGHDIGDQVLKLVASKMAKVKSGGRIFRYGGEEFTVVFPRKNIDQTWRELENLRQSIADYEMIIRQPERKNKDARNKGKNADMKSVSVTISIGVAMRSSKQSFEQVLKASDEALYRAKKAGRNKVCE